MARGKKGSDGLTDKQREYTRLRAAGKSQIESYTMAGYGTGSSKHTKEVNAMRLEKLQQVKENIERLQYLADNGAIMSTEQRKAALYEIYLDNTVSTKDRLKALDLLNRMSGDYIDRKEINATIQGLSRDDRLDAMNKTLESLKKAWNDSSIEE